MSDERYQKIYSLFPTSSTPRRSDVLETAGRSSAFSESPSRSSAAVPRSPGVLYRDKILRFPVPLRRPDELCSPLPPLPSDSRQYGWVSQVSSIGVLACTVLGVFELLVPLRYQRYHSRVSACSMHAAFFVMSFARLNSLTRVVLFVSGGLNEIFGQRAIIAIGSATYPIFIAYTRLGNFYRHPPAVDTVFDIALGANAALFWASIGGILTAYPEMGQQGAAFALFWSIYALAGIGNGLYILLEPEWFKHESFINAFSPTGRILFVLVGIMVSATIIVIFSLAPANRIVIKKQYDSTKPCLPDDLLLTVTVDSTSTESNKFLRSFFELISHRIFWLLIPLFVCHQFQSGYEASFYWRLGESQITVGIGILFNSFGHIVGAVAVALCLDGYMVICFTSSRFKKDSGISVHKKGCLTKLLTRQVRFQDRDLNSMGGSSPGLSENKIENKKTNKRIKGMLKKSPSSVEAAAMRCDQVMKCGTYGVTLLVCTRIAWLSCGFLLELMKNPIVIEKLINVPITPKSGLLQTITTSSSSLNLKLDSNAIHQLESDRQSSRNLDGESTIFDEHSHFEINKFGSPLLTLYLITSGLLGITSAISHGLCFWTVGMLASNRFFTCVHLSSIFKGLESLGQSVSFGLAATTRQSASYREFFLLLIVTFLLSLPAAYYVFLNELPQSFAKRNLDKKTDGNEENPSIFRGIENQDMNRSQSSQSSLNLELTTPSVRSDAPLDLNARAEHSASSIVYWNDLENMKALGFRCLPTPPLYSQTTAGSSDGFQMSVREASASFRRSNLNGAVIGFGWMGHKDDENLHSTNGNTVVFLPPCISISDESTATKTYGRSVDNDCLSAPTFLSWESERTGGPIHTNFLVRITEDYESSKDDNSSTRRSALAGTKRQLIYGNCVNYHTGQNCYSANTTAYNQLLQAKISRDTDDGFGTASATFSLDSSCGSSFSDCISLSDSPLSCCNHIVVPLSPNGSPPCTRSAWKRFLSIISNI